MFILNPMIGVFFQWNTQNIVYIFIDYVLYFSLGNKYQLLDFVKAILV